MGFTRNRSNWNGIGGIFICLGLTLLAIQLIPQPQKTIFYPRVMDFNAESQKPKGEKIVKGTIIERYTTYLRLSDGIQYVDIDTIQVGGYPYSIGDEVIVTGDWDGINLIGKEIELAPSTVNLRTCKVISPIHIRQISNSEMYIDVCSTMTGHVYSGTISRAESPKQYPAIFIVNDYEILGKQ